MKPQPGDVVGCMDCQADFELPPPAEDIIYIPTCPECGSVVDGYEDAVDFRKRNSEAQEACKTLERELEEIIDQTQSMRNRVPEGSSLEALREATTRLQSLTAFATNRTEELTDED
ncbi:hypothetical protein [Haloarcula nitratireducens]|uniref:Small CPxCG-related zinc finger protein n=1 Tax=Haloarcula nitratireducens TaxID=2487749 RepID=A0AAW4PC08_9EURY|nr:hypothetical protein [Halomicroarcula nitratireducens]MBX0295434.1 hypothetical protein [Halomicroarcula nitratireducens]